MLAFCKARCRSGVLVFVHNLLVGKLNVGSCDALLVARIPFVFQRVLVAKSDAMRCPLHHDDAESSVHFLGDRGVLFCRLPCHHPESRHARALEVGKWLCACGHTVFKTGMSACEKGEGGMIPKAARTPTARCVPNDIKSAAAVTQPPPVANRSFIAVTRSQMPARQSSFSARVQFRHRDSGLSRTRLE